MKSNGVLVSGFGKKLLNKLYQIFYGFGFLIQKYEIFSLDFNLS